MIAIGKSAPAFKVQAHDETWLSLSDFLGKKVVLWFFPKADTPGCTAEGCGFRDLFPKYEAKNAVVLGVSFDSCADNRKFVEKFQFPYPLLCDVNREIGLAYGACKSETDEYANRIGYVIDEKGVVIKAYGKVDAKTFPHTLLNEI